MIRFTQILGIYSYLKKVEDYNPDVIHLHNIHGYYINIEILFDYLKRANKKVVWTLHDCWAFTGHCAYFDYVGCNKWQDGCKECPQKNEYPNSLLIDSSEWNFNKKKDIFTGVPDLTIVTPSKWLAGLVKQSFLSEYKVEVINNGIDLNIFKPTKSDFRERYGLENKFIILGVANVWDRRKGLQYLIDLAEKIDDNYKVIIVGVSEKQKKSLPKNIIGITRTNDVRELVEIYSVADVFVNPTLEDNFPTTNLEALACGTYVITFNSGGSGECLKLGGGKVINNSQEIYDEIKKYNNCSNKNSRIKNQNRYYDNRNTYKYYCNIYDLNNKAGVK